MTVTLANGAVINIAAGASSGTAVVAAPTDDAYIDADSVSATISSSTGGNFENLITNGAAASTSISDTLDSTTVTLSSDTSGSNVSECGSIIYTASVDNPVTARQLGAPLSTVHHITNAIAATSADRAPVQSGTQEGM